MKEIRPMGTNVRILSSSIQRGALSYWSPETRLEIGSAGTTRTSRLPRRVTTRGWQGTMTRRSTDMARKWTEVRRDASASGLIDEQQVENARREMTGEVRAFRLAEIRKGQHVSQKTLANGMRVSQARVSTIERGELSRTELGTLQAYVEALGGYLKVVADFGDETLVVRD